MPDLAAPTVSFHQIRWDRWLPPLSIHLLCVGVVWVGWSWTAVTVAIALYWVRMFVITAFYHRYFSHRTFATSRVVQALAAFVGATCAQRGAMWWAAHHRRHHSDPDGPTDLHSPRRHGILWSHLGWFLAEPNLPTRVDLVPDLARYPELRWLDRHHMVGPLFLAVGLWLLGAALAAWAPSCQTSGAQLVVWGLGVSTTVLYHGTFTINSLAHVFGRRRYATPDDSRNNWFLALITMGEGWHNNHHGFPGTVRQGFRWWEVDVTWYLLRLMACIGLVWDLRPIPAAAFTRTGKLVQAPASA